MKETNLIEGEIKGTLVRFSLPFLLTYILENLYGAVDMAVVGHFAAASDVSAIATGSQVMNTILMVCLGFCNSITVLVGRKTGEKDMASVRKVIGNTTTILSFLAAALIGIVVFGNSFIVRAMQTPAEAVAGASSYLLICGLGIPFIVGYNIVCEIYHGFGDAKTPLLFIAIASVFHLLFDLLIVGHLGMGATGAAISTVISQGISFGLGVWHLRFGKAKLRISRSDLVLDKVTTGSILKIGLPMVLYYLQRNISYLIVTAIINTGGLIASAAAGVTETIVGFALLIPSSVGSAISVMTAQNLGAGRRDRAEQSLFWGMKICVGTGIVVFVLSQIAPQMFTALLINNPEVVETAALYLRTYSIDCVLLGISICMNAFFIGNGKSFICMSHVIVAAFLGRIPLSYIISRIPGTTLWHMGFAAPAGSMISVIILIASFLYYKKKVWNPT